MSLAPLFSVGVIATSVPGERESRLIARFEMPVNPATAV
jgi:hypothetical protein